MSTPGLPTIASPTGRETVRIDSGGAVEVQMSIATLAAISRSLADNGYQTNALAASGLLTAANITGGIGVGSDVTLDLSGNPAGAANAQMPTVASLVAGVTSFNPGQTYRLRIINGANSGTWTITTNTGWTLNGTMTIATGTCRDFYVTLTSATAAALQNIGGGTI